MGIYVAMIIIYFHSHDEITVAFYYDLQITMIYINYNKESKNYKVFFEYYFHIELRDTKWKRKQKSI